jgi:signal peptidase II
MSPIYVLIILSLDQLTKFLVRKFLALNQSVPVLSGVFHITLVYNRGAAFGILKNQLPLFIATSLFAISLIFLNFRRNKSKAGSIYGVSLGLILAGALGNLIDRLWLGYVVDFLDFRVWPVFNIADSAITIGALLLGYTVLKSKECSQ